ncbi:MAG: hypothetical protein ACOX6E_04450, partial [Syntrophomonadaceae bacterium]
MDSNKASILGLGDTGRPELSYAKISPGEYINSGRLKKLDLHTILFLHRKTKGTVLEAGGRSFCFLFKEA